MNESSNSSGAPVARLCLACGLCCNGVIFVNVKLQPPDNAARLRALGMPVAEAAGRGRLAQPCAAFDGCRCRIYGERPKYCREFECLLLKSTQAGHTSVDEALRVISTARQRAERVRRLLRALGDTDEQAPLSRRFRRTRKRLEEGGLDEGSAEAYGELTLAVHDLNLLLSEAFYPGDGRGGEPGEEMVREGGGALPRHLSGFLQSAFKVENRFKSQSSGK